MGWQGRRTVEPQDGQAAVVRPGAIWILPWAQCIRQCHSSLGSNLIHCSVSSRGKMQQQY